MVIGLLLFAGSKIITRYLDLPDFAEGLLIGTGIGLIIAGIQKKKREPNNTINTDVKN